MFDSGIKAKDLIDQIRDEADIAYPISDESFIIWLNALEQLLYTELIREQNEVSVSIGDIPVVNLSLISHSSGENTMRFEDIHAVYAGETQLILSTVASESIFPNTYYKIGNNIGLNVKDGVSSVLIVYFVKPKLKTADNISTTNVMLPVEFIDLAKAKLRGEAYKLANEDGLAAKWINDYNTLLEVFKTWLSGKAPQFGL